MMEILVAAFDVAPELLPRRFGMLGLHSGSDRLDLIAGFTFIEMDAEKGVLIPRLHEGIEGRNAGLALEYYTREQVVLMLLAGYTGEEIAAATVEQRVLDVDMLGTLIALQHA